MTYDELEERTQKAGMISKFRAFLNSLTPVNLAKWSTKGTWKLAFVVGHNSRSQGAQNNKLKLKSEWLWNKAIGKAMVTIANLDPDIQVKVFYREYTGNYGAEISSCYKKVEAWNPHLIYEGHFDWQEGAGIVKMLYAHFSSKSKLASEIVLSNTAALMNEPKTKLVPKSGGNGYASLVGATAPTVLLEPFDSTNDEHIKRVNELSPYDFALNYIVSAKETLAQLYPTVVMKSDISPPPTLQSKPSSMLQQRTTQTQTQTQIMENNTHVSDRQVEKLKARVDALLQREQDIEEKLASKIQELDRLEKLVDSIGG